MSKVKKASLMGYAVAVVISSLTFFYVTVAFALSVIGSPSDPIYSPVNFTNGFLVAGFVSVVALTLLIVVPACYVLYKRSKIGSGHIPHS